MPKVVINSTNTKVSKGKRETIVELHLANGSRRYIDGEDLKRRSGAKNIGQTKQLEAYLNSDEGYAYVEVQNASYFLEFLLNDDFPEPVNDQIRVHGKMIDELAEMCRKREQTNK